MGVELSTALNILAHELRGPLSVIQGYLRLLRQRRAGGDDEARMLSVMQDATGRLTALGRQIVDLAVTLEHPPLRDGSDSVGSILDGAIQHAALVAPPSMQVPDSVAQARIPFGSSPAVGAALGAVLQAVAKEAAGAPLTIVGTAHDGNGIELTMGPVDLLAGRETNPNRFEGEEHLRLDRGGVGLSLVLASYVFDAIGARLTSIGPDGNAIAVALRKDGGLL